ncbi:hypothetical protein TU94_22290 [Streptomyces cyaneogriseus subsp. noncyanogenus]|uniref:Uncharacterized protein n=1 Tax=Streptomyces cyaneogriseus subsp. noncyanogenus TaxID=477245 RepID=A0A0C5G6A1_9ACTN|nr:hypothetical protein [Streptomyces cyaneogriseus]AJP03804.1 hypothetical protein TU94_22290 [Streptomyces cyaneogriseus subsp. noncyanogenus]
MFEIRVICDPTDTDRVTTALNGAFATGTVRQYPTRDGERQRLYVTAEHRPEPGPWPTPEEAYALAPNIIREIGWTAQTAADKPFGMDLDREYWLRKAALLDRIALREEEDGVTGDAAGVATEAARRLVAYDRDGEGDYHGAPYWPEHPATDADPRGYIRQEYAHWARHH